MASCHITTPYNGKCENCWALAYEENHPSKRMQLAPLFEKVKKKLFEDLFRKNG